MIRRTEMNSPTLISPAYISEFWRRINKFSGVSIMHDFIFIISSGEARRPDCVSSCMQRKKAGSSLKIGVSTLSALCQIITVYSAKHGIIRCIAAKIYNESEGR